MRWGGGTLRAQSRGVAVGEADGAPPSPLLPARRSPELSCHPHLVPPRFPDVSAVSSRAGEDVLPPRLGGAPGTHRTAPLSFAPLLGEREGDFRARLPLGTGVGPPTTFGGPH